jgi:endonuclease YncB( thermonuclease family)
VKRYIVLLALAVLASSIIIFSERQDSFAHQSGCHRWHSCPSDTGSYVCGDLGYDTYCHKSNAPKYEPPKETQTQQKPIEKANSNNYEKNKVTTISTCSGTALCITGKVMKIVDGDTIHIKNHKIRLSLVDTPEKNEKGFNEAKSFTTKLCPLRSIIIVDQDDMQPYDRNDRLVGKVTCSGKVLNAELIRNGHAHILTEYCKKSEFASENWAKSSCQK